jgi:membrane-bound serine protease (ClpP class)
MVDPRTKIPGINDSGKVLTFTSSEAFKNGYCNGIVENIPELLKMEGFVNYKIEKFVPTFIDEIIGFLISPAISGVLILIMLGGLYYELQHPGIGVPIILAIVAAILYFAPLYLEGLAQNWEIIISIVGILLLITEIFIIPGFGIAGISGILLLLVGLTTSLLRNDGFDFSEVSSIAIYRSMAIVLASMAGMLGVFIAGSKMLAASPAFSKMVLAENQASSEGFTSATIDLNSLIGSVGITQTVLRPTGKITIDNRSYFASCENGFIEEATPIVVISIAGNLLLVKRQEEL